VLLFLGCVLVFQGALALAWYAYLQLDILLVQRAANRLIDEQRRHNSQSSGDRSLSRTLVIVPPRPGEPIGRIEIARLHMSVMILEGTAPRILRVAAGHIGGTALPGGAGNIGIAAHRDTLFRALKDIRHQDKIVVTTSYGTFRYVVDGVEIVDPTDVQVLRGTADPELTLITCYPFTYLGAAPKRFVIHARQELS
jgi:sortase A